MKRTLLATLLAASFNASAVLLCANDTYSQHGTWYVGNPTTAMDAIDTDGVVWCEASGAELAFIKRGYTGLRFRIGPNVDGHLVAFWTGDDAVFILDNL